MPWDLSRRACAVPDKWYVVAFPWVAADRETAPSRAMFRNMAAIVAFDDRDGSDDEVEDGVDGPKWEEAENQDGGQHHQLWEVR